MYKIINICLLLLLVGCSNQQIKPTETPKTPETTETTIEEESENSFLTLIFEGTKLVVENHSEDVIVVADSKTKVSVEKNGEWVLVDKIVGTVAVTTGILSKEKTDFNFDKDFAEIQSQKIKVTIYYQYGYTSDVWYSKSIIYNK